MNRKTVDNQWHKTRMRAEKRFRFYGQCALGLAVLMLVVLVGSIVSRGYQGVYADAIAASHHLRSGTPRYTPRG